MNRVMLTGRLTRDPEMRTVANGKTVTTFSIATNEYRGGQEKAEFHTIVTWDRLAEIAAQYLRKGSQVYIEGSLRTRKWQDKEGRDQYTTEIVASDMQMLGGKSGGGSAPFERDGGEMPAAPRASGRPAPAAQPPAASGGFDDNLDDDIPF